MYIYNVIINVPPYDVFAKNICSQKFDMRKIKLETFCHYAKKAIFNLLPLQVLIYLL